MSNWKEWKYNLFRKRLEKDLKFRKSDVAKPPINNAQNIGVLWTEKEQYPLPKIKGLLRDWENRGSEAYYFCYFPNLKKDEPLPFDGIAPTNINWLGIPKWDSIKQFVDKPFDLLLVLDEFPPPPVEYIQCHSMARFKIGIGTNPSKELDLKLETGDQFDLDKFWRDLTFFMDKFSLKT